MEYQDEWGHQYSSTQENGTGVKYDQGKLRWDLMPLREMEQVVEVFTYGAQKYGDRNWEKGIALDRLYAAAMRHITAKQKGIEVDEESGLDHLAHATANLLMWMHLAKK